MHDRRQIFDFIEIGNLSAALDLDKRFLDAAKLLASHPALGRTGKVRGTRELVVDHHYLLIYDTPPGAVRVLRVMHTSRNWPMSG